MARNRSYRASSVFSNYSIPKRRKTHSRRKEKRSKPRVLEATLSDDSERAMVIEGDSASDDEELLKLRLNALKSKQEVKELIDITDVDSEEPMLLPAPVAEPTEEDQLRIMALRSTLLKKSKLLRLRKKLKMLENDRPYSPSEELTPLMIDNDAMILSPLGSPFNEVPEITHQEDMDICNSPFNEEKESSDMDTAPSPGEAQLAQENSPPQDDNDEEVALRSLLLKTFYKKKEVSPSRTPSPKAVLSESGTETTRNLKLALQRLKQKEKKPEPPPLPPPPVVKSGTKTIAMVLAEKKNKVIKTKVNKAVVMPEAPDQQLPIETEKTPPEPQLQTEPPVEAPVESASFMFRTIKNDFVMNQKEIDGKAMPGPPPKPAPRISPIDSVDVNLFSTITDTKNIPLLPTTDKPARSRLITTLVPKPVQRLVISVNADSDTDEESARSRKVPVSKPRIVHAPVRLKVPVAPPSFELKLDSFLKKIRENTFDNPTPTTSKAVDKPMEQSKTASSAATKHSSFVKHLPLASQLEYEELLKKMKILEEKKQKRLKARQLKRTKSNSGLEPSASDVTAKPPIAPPPKKTKIAETPKPEAVKKKPNDKIAESLGKIPQLDLEAQQRLIVKAEINFKNHRCVDDCSLAWVIGEDASFLSISVLFLFSRSFQLKTF